MSIDELIASMKSGKKDGYLKNEGWHSTACDVSVLAVIDPIFLTRSSEKGHADGVRFTS